MDDPKLDAKSNQDVVNHISILSTDQKKPSTAQKVFFLLETDKKAA